MMSQDSKMHSPVNCYKSACPEICNYNALIFILSHQALTILITQQQKAGGAKVNL